MGTFNTELEFFDFVKDKMLNTQLAERFVSDIVVLSYDNDQAYKLLEDWLAAENPATQRGLEAAMLDLLEEKR